jgi:hypothetical protein
MCGRAPSTGRPLVVCSGCGAAQYCSEKCLEQAAVLSEDSNTGHALFCPLIARLAAAAGERFAGAAALYWSLDQWWMDGGSGGGGGTLGVWPREPLGFVNLGFPDQGARQREDVEIIMLDKRPKGRRLVYEALVPR